jgi:hypothetical protein
MVAIAPGVYAEPGMTEVETRELLAARVTAAANVKQVFGAPRDRLPLTLFCRTAMCKMTFGAPAASAGASDLGFARDGLVTKEGYLATPVVVATGPVPNTAKILTHELVHAEMKSWAPYDALPTWFNEGMATWVADEPDCRAAPQVSAFDVRQLDTKAKWQAHLAGGGGTLRTYCQARDAAGEWAGKFGDRASVGKATRKVCEAPKRRSPLFLRSENQVAPNPAVNRVWDTEQSLCAVSDRNSKPVQICYSVVGDNHIRHDAQPRSPPNAVAGSSMDTDQSRPDGATCVLCGYGRHEGRNSNLRRSARFDKN